jgi:hypothetical protein
MNFTASKSKALASGLTALLVVAGFSPIRVAAAAPKAHPAPLAAAAQNDKLDFDLVNRTGYTLKHVLISRSSASEWNDDDDVLGGQKLDDGETLHISFAPRAHADHWDMKVVYAIDGSSHEWDGLNLSQINKITLHYNADSNSTSADTE